VNFHRYYDMSIRNLRFSRSATSTTVNAIELQRAARVTIEGCAFERYNAAVYVIPLSLGVGEVCHTIQVNILNCTGTTDLVTPTPERRIRYLLRIPANLAGGAFAAADFTVSGCKVDSLVSNIYCQGIDGLIVNGNIFFMGGYYEESTIKENNINIDLGAQIAITGNNLFESGFESILLNRCQNFTVTGNVLVWPGERDMKSGIVAKGGDIGGLEFCIGAITGNTILFPTKHGVSIEGVCGNIAVTGNMIRGAGFDGTAYYGVTDLGSITHYGVNTEATTQQITVVGNLTPANLNNVLGARIHFAENLDIDGDVLTHQGRLEIIGAGVTSIDVSAARIVACGAVSAHTLSTIVGGKDSMEVTFVATTANTTIQNNAGIKLKGATNATIAAGGTITLRHMEGNWYEVGRSF
jgi:hypothetical protein